MTDASRPDSSAVKVGCDLTVASFAPVVEVGRMPAEMTERKLGESVSAGKAFGLTEKEIVEKEEAVVVLGQADEDLPKRMWYDPARSYLVDSVDPHQKGHSVELETGQKAMVQLSQVHVGMEMPGCIGLAHQFVTD